MDFSKIAERLVKKYANNLEIEDGEPLATIEVARTGSVYIEFWLLNGNRVDLRLADHARGCMGGNAFWAKNYKEAIEYLDGEIK